MSHGFDFANAKSETTKERKWRVAKMPELNFENLSDTLLSLNKVFEEDTAKAIKEVDLRDSKNVKRTTLTQMMKQSFFHGANRFGTNFIA